MIKYDAHHIPFYNYGGGTGRLEVFGVGLGEENLPFSFYSFVYEITKVMEGPTLFVQHILKKERWEKKKETRTRILWAMALNNVS